MLTAPDPTLGAPKLPSWKRSSVARGFSKVKAGPTHQVGQLRKQHGNGPPVPRLTRSPRGAGAFLNPGESLCFYFKRLN